MYQISVILPNQDELFIPYYEIGSFIESYVHQWLTTNQQNKIIFDLFKQDYNSYQPYLDFALCYLGVKIKNPFIFEESILSGQKDYLINEYANNRMKSKTYLPLSDKNYKIKKASVDCLKTSLLSPNGIQYEVNRDLGVNHFEISQMILLEKMIYNKELYEDYIYCMKNPYLQCAYPNVERYIRGRLGFVQIAVYEDKSGFVICNEDLLDDFMKSFLNGIKDYYPNISLDNRESLKNYLSDEEIDKAINIKENVGEKYESRRI